MMWDYYYTGGSWVWMTVMMVLFWGGLGTLLFLVVRTFAPNRRGGDAAIEILRRRLAGGEISQEEFDRTRKALQG